MPKIIEHLRENILASAKSHILSDGYRALTIRDIAEDCGIAAGTVYNYFSSKEDVVIAVQIEDWSIALENMRVKIAGAQTLSEGLYAVRDEIVAFSDIYRTMWDQSPAMVGARGRFAERHVTIVHQIERVLQPLVERTFPKAPPMSALFLAENVLITTNSSELTLEMVVEMLAGIEHYSNWK